MLGNDERANAHKHNQRRDNDAALVAVEHLLTVSPLIHQPLGDKYRIVVALTENKRGENHIDNIKLDAQNIHHAENPYPPHRHRSKRHQRKLQSAKRNP